MISSRDSSEQRHEVCSIESRVRHVTCEYSSDSTMARRDIDDPGRDTLVVFFSPFCAHVP